MLQPHGRDRNTPGITVQYRPLNLSSSNTGFETCTRQDTDEDKTMKTIIRRSIASAALLGNAALIAMLAISSTILVSHA